MRRALDRIGGHARMLVTRGRIIKAALNSKRMLLQVSGLANEILNNVEGFTPYGMSAYPMGGEDVILLQVGQSRAHLVALFADASGLRITDLQPGEFGWKDVNAQQVVFRKDHIEITTAKKVIGTASEWNLTGAVKITGDVNVTGKITATDEVTAKNTHTVSGHTHTDPQGGSSGTPTG